MRAVSVLVSLAALAACSQAAQAPARDPQLDRLFAQLAQAQDAATARPIETQIWARWAESGSPTVDILIERATAAQEAGDRTRALEFLERATSLAPNFAEPWNRRASIAYQAHDFPTAISAIQETLRREPRHFGALTALGLIYEELGQDRQALDAFRAALAIDPSYEAARRGADRLSTELEGRDA